MSRPHRNGPRTAARLFRIGIVAALVLLAAGCTSMARSSADALRMVVKRDLRITPEQVAANRYAQIRVDGPDGAALLVLGNDDAGLTSWYAPGRIVFLRNGVIAGSHGYPQDATDIRLLGDDPFARLDEVTTATTLRRYDWMPGYRYGVEVQGQLRRGAIEDIEILGSRHHLQRFDEVLTGPGVEATNVYWAEPDTGLIRRSRQFVAPGTELDITVLRPYRPRSTR
ncbi:YjbF family lipoprotein [Luteimonas sp. BDR2-5]|uniref:YjbF family lipoprotein n=1 Tax=Proluteimonas luteida TaxID=2878685 RepID=UPI001E37433B|nr:YjbF family lipoprotein [Luteimonas sp. BDR2-5]MCD9028703.1 YjbF family lipoprotein [Luteimonas sp. BDR2-5]